MGNEEVEIDANTVNAYRAVIDGFIQERLQLKLDAIGADLDGEKRRTEQEKYRRDTWIGKAAESAKYLQVATHLAKATHPSIKGASSVRLLKPWVTSPALVGTHVLENDLADDVAVDNAAALYVWDFLKTKLGEKSLLTRIVERSPTTLAALSSDSVRANELAIAFAGIVEKQRLPASHTLAKQLYFPLQEGGYHLLAPLFPTALAHRLHTTLQEDRFSDATKAAREARKAGQDHPQGYREYPNMVVQNFGGSKPQNISQLNSERGGANHLLPSVPPLWSSEGIKPPLRHASIFDKGGPVRGSKEMRFWVKKLSKYLVAEADRNNVQIREKRAAMVDEIIYTVLDLATQIQCLPSGWSQVPQCKLSSVEKCWLDAVGVAEAGLPPNVDWQNDVAERFGAWLNAAISTDRTVMGDIAFLEWKHRFLEKLRDEA